MRFKQNLSSKMSFDNNSTSEEETLISGVSNFMQTIEAYSDTEFQSCFKMKRSTLDPLIVKYALSRFYPSHSNHGGGKQKIEAKKEVYLFAWYLTSTGTFNELANTFGIVKSTAWAAVGRVSNWLVSLGPEYIKWPQGDVVDQICAKFESKHQIPCVIGAIDCTHITIGSNKECFYNRKLKFSIILQAVVDADMKFIDICCGEPGSLDDSTVLRKSMLYQKVQTIYNRLFPSNTFLLGDAAYAASDWIVPPFKNYYQLNDQGRYFNDIHNSTRMVVEHAFRLLKGRFKRINKFTEQRNLNLVKKIVVSACVLHNLCILEDDNFIIDEEPTTVEDILEHNSDNNIDLDLPDNRRDRLFWELCERNII